MKVIFLDIDGVLCTWQSMKRDEDEHEETGRVTKFEGTRWYCRLAADCIERINKITDATGAVIVISSAWRSGNAKMFAQLCRYLKHCGVKAKVVGRTPYVYEEHPDYKHGRHVERGHEIQMWMDDCDDEIESFIIIDDESDMVHLKDRLVQIYGGMNGGIQDEHAEKAIALLQSSADCRAEHTA